MKLKKKHFARLQKITECISGLNRCDLDALIADIESVQKVKTVQDRPLTGEVYERPSDFMERIYDQHRKDVRTDFIKQGASSYDPNIPFTRGLRDTVESLSDPKIGDVGYFFNSNPNYAVIYGKLKNFTGDNYQNDFGNWFNNFSKTPPELK